MLGEIIGFAVLGDALELSAGLPRHSHTVTIIYGITYFIVSNCLTVVLGEQIAPTESISVGVGLPRALAEQSPWFKLLLITHYSQHTDPCAINLLRTKSPNYDNVLVIY